MRKRTLARAALDECRTVKWVFEKSVGIARLTTRQILIVVHDLVATAAAIIASFYIRFETAGLLDRLDALLVVLPGYLVYAGLVSWLFHLYRGKWRFASLPDLGSLRRDPLQSNSACSTPNHQAADAQGA